MLRDIYLSAGGVGSFFIAIGMFVTFIGWWMAITETVTRESLNNVVRVLIVLSVSLLPPLGIVVSAWFIRKDGRKVSKAMKAASNSNSRTGHGLSLSLSPRPVKAA